MSPPPQPSPVRVLIVDDSPLIRLGLRAALEDRPEIAIVAEAGTAGDGVRAAAEHRPDVVLLDLRLPDQSGFTACREIVRQGPQTKVIILTSATEERNVQDAVSVGAKGYLLKDNDGATLARAIAAVAKGHSILDPSLASQLMNLVKHGGASSAADKLGSLSQQEYKVVALLADGLTNKEIADRLGLTEKTVKNYLASVFSKLNISRRTQAVALFTAAKSSRAEPLS